MAEDVLDVVQRDALAVEQRGAGVAQVVKADPRDGGGCHDMVEVAVDVSGFEGCPDPRCEDQPGLLPPDAGLLPLGGLEYTVAGQYTQQGQGCLLYTSPSPRDGLLS